MYQLVSLIKQQKLRALSDSQIGIAVDLLCKLDYFNQLAQSYGKFYLFFIFHHNIIDIYNLRQHHPLIDTRHLYILIQGEVNKNGFQNGTEIIVQRDGQIQTLRDSLFLKISIEKMKSWPKLKQLQKEINKNRFLIDVEVQQNEMKEKLSRKLMKIEIFNKLTKFDFQQLLYGCQLRVIKKGKSTHEYQTPVDTLIFIIQGELKLSFPYNVQSQPTKVNHALKRFITKQSTTNKNQITAIYNSGQWIGIDEHLQGIPIKSSGMVMSVQAELVCVPVGLFDKLFNCKWNHTLFRKIEYFKQIRVKMLEKSLKTQIQKESEMLRWSQEKDPLSIEYRRKMSKYQIGLQPGENMQNPELQKQQITLSIKSRIHMKHKKPLFKDSLLSIDQTLHNSNKTTNPISLNKQFTRVNLFPEEYSREFVYPSQQREISHAEKIKNTNIMMYLSPKDHRKACTKQHSHSFSSVNDSSFEAKMFQMAKNVTQNFAQNSTFYRRQFNKGDELSNLNFKTIDAIEHSRRKLMLKRKNQISLEKSKKQYNCSDVHEIFLPDLGNKVMVKDFQPMSRRKPTVMNLSQYMVDQKYNIESKKTLASKSKQSAQTITIRNSRCQLMELKTNNKTLFVKPDSAQESKAHKTIDTTTLSRRKTFKKQSFPLSIE